MAGFVQRDIDNLAKATILEESRWMETVMGSTVYEIAWDIYRISTFHTGSDLFFHPDNPEPLAGAE
jgi:hypothetical protein